MNLVKMSACLLSMILITFFCVIGSQQYEEGDNQEFHESIDNSVFEELQKYKEAVKLELMNGPALKFRPDQFPMEEDSIVDGFRDVDEVEDFDGKEKECLNGCKCQFKVSAPSIDCALMKWDHVPLPVTRPYLGYNHLSLKCNDIVTVPEYEMFLKAFPHLREIDLRGNPNLNCSSLKRLNNRIKCQSDCGGKPTPCQSLPAKPEKRIAKYNSDEELVHDLTGRLDTILEIINMHTDD